MNTEAFQFSTLAVQMHEIEKFGSCQNFFIRYKEKNPLDRGPASYCAKQFDVALISVY